MWPEVPGERVEFLARVSAGALLIQVHGSRNDYTAVAFEGEQRSIRRNLVEL